MGLGLALFPYIFLTVVAVLASGVPPITEILSRFEIGLPFPALTTGGGVTIPPADPYSPFAPLTHPGTFVLIASLVALLVYRAKGYYDPARMEGPGLLRNLIKDSVPSSIAIASFLTMSKLMDHSGQTSMLAQGIAAVATVPSYAFAANWIGILGAFMTSSSTAANILFSPLQAQAAASLPGLSQSTVRAAQSAGGAVGNVIAPANIVIGTSTVRIVGQEGAILRGALPWAILAGVVTGLATIVLNLLGGAMSPRGILLISALAMLLVALPLISIGSVRGVEMLWAAGLVVSAGGFVLPLALRFLPVTETAEDEPDVSEEPS